MPGTADPLQETLTLLSDNWTAGSTDEKTPRFLKITDLTTKRIQFEQNSDFVIAQRSRPKHEPAGVGKEKKHKTESFNLDIRVQGANDFTAGSQEGHFLNVVEQVRNILDQHILNPTSNFDELIPDGEGTDLSDKTHRLWRILIPIKLRKFVIQR